MGDLAKSRVTYPKELRQLAKDRGIGVFTVSVRRPDGTFLEWQGTGDARKLDFIRWAAIASQVVPDAMLEQIVKQHTEGL